MNTSMVKKNGLSETEKLEQQADAARARLLEVVDALDAKRHALKTVASKPTPMLPVIALPVGAAALGAAAFVLSTRRRPKLFEQHQPPFWSSVLRSVSVSLVAMAMTEAAKLGLKRLAVAPKGQRR